MNIALLDHSAFGALIEAGNLRIGATPGWPFAHRPDAADAYDQKNNDPLLHFDETRNLPAPDAGGKIFVRVIADICLSGTYDTILKYRLVRNAKNSYIVVVVQGLRTLERLVRGTLPYLRRHLERLFFLRDLVRINEETFHLILAGIVGVMGGLVNLFFYACTELTMKLVLHDTGDVVEIAHLLPWWQRLAIPALGAVFSGLLLYWGLQLVGNQGASNILEVVVSGNGRLPMRTALVKSISSLISIATGASIGREGPITQMSATVASKLGQIANWPPYRLRLLVACGAAAGLAAPYNAPIAGSLFAAQIVLGSFAMNLFGPLVFSAVIATMVSRYFFGIRPFYEIPNYDFTYFSQLPWFVVLGVASGFLSAGFLKLLRWSEEGFAKLKIPIYWRLGIAGLVVGALAIQLPEVWGNGYGAITRILHGPTTEWFLVALFLSKLIATLASVGSGTVGGVFTPTLFLGAALGSLFGSSLKVLDLTALPTGAFAMVGMGSLLAGTTHAPLLAMIMIFEISLNYSIMPPLMLACTLSTLVSRGLHRDSVYTEPLRRKGITAHEDDERLGAATHTSVGEIMREPIPPVRPNTPFSELAARFLTSTNNFIPVVDENQSLVGVVALQDMKEHLHSGAEMNGVIAYDIMRESPATLTPNQKLTDAFPALLQSELRNVPVVNNRIESRLVGSVRRSEALQMISEALTARRAV
jgi:CIC family chloride channel protein